MLGAQVSATNLKPTYSGSDRQTPAPSAEDRRILKERLYDALQETALQEMRKELAEGDLLIADSLSLLRVIEESFLPAENQPADQLALNLRLEYQARLISAQDLTDLARAIFDANLNNPVAATDQNTFEAKVDVLEPLGPEYTAYINTGKHDLLATIDSGTKIEEGKPSRFVVNLDALHIFDADSEVAVR